MPCYREGGCGPYSMLSCSECPASKISYLNQNGRKRPVVPEIEIDGIKIGRRPLNMLTPLSENITDEPVNPDKAREYITAWLMKHRKSKDGYAALFSDMHVRENLTKLPDAAISFLKKFMENPETCPSLQGYLMAMKLKTVHRMTGILKGGRVIAKPDTALNIIMFQGQIVLTGIPSIDPMFSDLTTLIAVYEAVKTFDDFVEITFVALREYAKSYKDKTYEAPSHMTELETLKAMCMDIADQIPDCPNAADVTGLINTVAVMEQKAEKKMALLARSMYDRTELSRADVIEMFINAGYEPQVVVRAMADI